MHVVMKTMYDVIQDHILIWHFTSGYQLHMFDGKECRMFAIVNGQKAGVYV